ncbi:MAG: poly-gamma-glutamate system protein [Lawsonibacter sp.]
MREGQGYIVRLLAAVLAVVWGASLLAALGAREGRTEYYDIQVAAAQQLERCFAAVHGYKEELGIPTSGEDLHGTGMIGESYTGITTTLGAIEAKRTTAWPDMGALCVRLLYEAGVRPGDTVGAGFSGSFPAMDLALVAACEAMGVELVCIASVGSSTYGANNPGLTFPEMMDRLREDGLIQTPMAAVTMGGEKDVGEDMDPELSSQIRVRLQARGLSLLDQPDFAQNLACRQNLYRQLGPIHCFVAVGGNVTSMGRGESGVSLGQGVLHPDRTPRLDDSSGLVQHYLAQGLPVINLLNIKKLTADYGLPYDPVEWPPIGQSAIYHIIRYPRSWLIAGLGGAAALLLSCGLVRFRRGGGWRGQGKEWDGLCRKKA